MPKYFSYSPDDGFITFDTEEEAKSSAEAYIQCFRDECSDGWSEEVMRVSWGSVSEYTTEVSREPAPEGSEFDYYVDYGLRPY